MLIYHSNFWVVTGGIQLHINSGIWIVFGWPFIGWVRVQIWDYFTDIYCCSNLFLILNCCISQLSELTVLAWILLFLINDGQWTIDLLNTALVCLLLKVRYIKNSHIQWTNCVWLSTDLLQPYMDGHDIKWYWLCQFDESMLVLFVSCCLLEIWPNLNGWYSPYIGFNVLMSYVADNLVLKSTFCPI